MGSSIKYYKEHPEKRREHMRQWRANRPGYKSAEGKLYRKRYPEKARLSCRKNYQKHKQERIQKGAIHARTYRARKHGATIGNAKDILKIYNRAKELRQSGFDVAVDHIFPLSKGGAHSVENLQIIYSFENSQKGDRLNYIPSIIFK
jgi:5-methylcytosine-specific restriction endonuclease McrA